MGDDDIVAADNLEDVLDDAPEGVERPDDTPLDLTCGEAPASIVPNAGEEAFEEPDAG